MAVKVLTIADVRAAGSAVLVTPETATTAADGFTIATDGDTMLLVTNTSADTNYDITVKKGTTDNAINDYTVEVAFGTTVLIKLESGEFYNTSGTNKGKYVIIPENAAVKVKAIRY